MQIVREFFGKIFESKIEIMNGQKSNFLVKIELLNFQRLACLSKFSITVGDAMRSIASSFDFTRLRLKIQISISSDYIKIRILPG